jgi:hypothetical protein
MSDDETKKGLEVSEVAKELNEGRLSRRGLFDRLAVLGLGLGSALALGATGADAASAPAASVTLKSTNPALDSIIQKPLEAQTIGETAAPEQVAYFHRFFHRYYRRFGPFGGHYNRYYNRHYNRY